MRRDDGPRLIEEGRYAIARHPRVVRIELLERKHLKRVQGGRDIDSLLTIMACILVSLTTMHRRAALPAMAISIRS